LIEAFFRDLIHEQSQRTDLSKRHDRQLQAHGWLLGKAEHYNRELALYPEDVIGFVKDTQDEQWQKFCALYPVQPEQNFWSAWRSN
jgi:type I restriction enzyme R subunit